MKKRQVLTRVMGWAGWLILGLNSGPSMGGVIYPNDPDRLALTRMEAEYIVACQDMDLTSPAYGAINNVYGRATWVVPSENAMAILGLVLAAEILPDPNYLTHAQLAADYLVRVQDSDDGAWCNQYDYDKPSDPGQSPRHTAEVMIALHKLGFDPKRYVTMSRGAWYLMDCQAVSNKGGRDDGLLGGGKDSHGMHQGWRWTHDNAYAYWALKAAEAWATKQGEAAFATTCASSTQRVLEGINTHLYDRVRNTGVWHIAIDGSGNPQWPSSGLQNLPSWIQYAPQMLDLPVQDVNSFQVGQWIHDSFQQRDGSCIHYEWEDGQCKTRKYPGYSFQAALCWFDTGHPDLAAAAIRWSLGSGLWQTRRDANNQAGGWIDWVEVKPTPGRRADWWQRFIDTSFYAIAACNGGYDFCHSREGGNPDSLTAEDIGDAE